MTQQNSPRATTSVELVGERVTRVGPDEFAGLPTARRTVEIVCASGSRHRSTWGGVAIPDLLSLGDAPSATTHLVFEARDGHAACVGVEGTAAGLLAFSRDGRPLAEDHAYENRFVSPDVDGARTVKGVERIEAVVLAPGERPEEFEALTTETPEMGSSRIGGSGMDG